MGIQFLWLMAGILMTIEDIIGMLNGELNPTFPILVAVVAMIIIKPWYLGLFWSIEIFALLNVPTSFILLVSKKARKADEENYQKEKLFEDIGL